MTYELVNMSDYYTFVAEDPEVVTTLVVLLGQGQYGSKPLEGGVEVPIMLFGGHDEWSQRIFNAPLSDVIDNVMERRKPELIAALRSLICGDRREFATDADRRAWNKKRHSSMNDIGGRADKMADALEKGMTELPAAPRQVFSR